MKQKGKNDVTMDLQQFLRYGYSDKIEKAQKHERYLIGTSRTVCGTAGPLFINRKCMHVTYASSMHITSYMLVASTHWTLYPIQ